MDLDTKRMALEHEIDALQQHKEDLVKANKSSQDQLDAATAELARDMEQVKALEPNRREVMVLEAQLEELNRQIDERRKMIDRSAKPIPRSHSGPRVPPGVR